MKMTFLNYGGEYEKMFAMKCFREQIKLSFEHLKIEYCCIGI